MAGQRRTLSDIIEPVPGSPELPASPPASPPPPPAVPEPSPTRTHGVADSRSSGVPVYQRMEVLAARLRPDQIAWLKAVPRDLKRKRRKPGERFTENTLLRVAVDAIRELEDELRGDSEEELRVSVLAAIRAGRRR